MLLYLPPPKKNKKRIGDLKIRTKSSVGGKEEGPRCPFYPHSLGPNLRWATTPITGGR